MDGLYEQFRIALHQVWRRRWLALAVAWGVAVLGWLVIALIPNSYEAKARLFVQMQSILPNQIGITAGRAQQPAAAAQADPDLERESGPRSSAAPTSTASSPASATWPASSRRCAQRIMITAQPDGVLEIKATSNISGFSNGQNARTAAATVQGLIDLFVEQNLAGDRRETGQSLQFLDEELRRREIALQEAEQRRVEFEQRFMGVLPGDGSIADRMSRGAGRARQSRAADRRRPGRAQRDARPARRDAADHARRRRRRQHGERPARRARGPAQPEPRPRLDRRPSRHRRCSRQQIARLRPYAAGRAAQRHRRACPIPPTSRCAR